MDQYLLWLKDFWRVFSYTLLEIGGNKISLLSLITALTIFYVGYFLSKFLDNLIGKVLEEKTKVDRGLRGSIQRFTRYAVLLWGALIALDTLGISLNSLAAFGAVLMVGIGFGLQNIAQNFISGLILLLERPIKLGDIVVVDGVSGKVVDIRARATIVQTRDDVAIIVPNSKFISENVINDNFSGDRIRLTLKVGVSYSSDPKLVEKILLEIAEGHKKVLKRPSPKVIFSDFADSSLNFDLLFWTTDIWGKDFLLSELRFQVVEKFKEHAIVIPFPQRDVHLFSHS